MTKVTGRYSMLLDGNTCFFAPIEKDITCLYFSKGEGSLSHGKKVFTISAPCVVLMQNHALVCLKGNGPLEARVVEGRVKNLDAALPPVMLLPDDGCELMVFFEAMFEKRLSEGAKDFAGLLAAVAQQAKHALAGSVPEYLLKIKELFDLEYAREINLDGLEQEFGKSRYKIVREFKEHWGCPPMEYLAKRRLDASKELLLETDLSVTEISEQTGFATCSYYVQSFKKRFGTTPTSFRRQSGALE